MSGLRLWTSVLLLASAATAILLVVSYTRPGDASVFAKSQEQQSSTKNERADTGDDHRHGTIQQHRREHDFDHGSKKNDDDDVKVFATNMVSGTVSVIDSRQQKVVDPILAGHETFGSQSSESVSVIDTERDYVITTIRHVASYANLFSQAFSKDCLVRLDYTNELHSI